MLSSVTMKALLTLDVRQVIQGIFAKDDLWATKEPHRSPSKAANTKMTQ